MELTNEFSVKVPIAQAWSILTDVERIAPCLPGAELQEVAGEEYRGVVKVKVGPITAQYKGRATFLERDDGGHRAVLRAEGRDTRGQGNASATITATLSPDGDGTAVRVVTDLTVTGKVAQFGRGVLADVSSKLLDQFVACLEQDLLGGPASESGPGPAPGEEPAPSGDGSRSTPSGDAGAAPTSGASPGAVAGAPPEGVTGRSEAAEPAVRRVDGPRAEPVDLLDAAGTPLLKRIVPAVAGAFGLLLLLRRWRRRR